MKSAKIFNTILFGITALVLGACGTANNIPHYYKGYYQEHPQVGDQELSSVGKTCFFCAKNKPAPAPAPVDGDMDRDGVLDSMDKCPGTPIQAKANHLGCWVLENLQFKTGRDKVEPVSFPILDEVVMVLQANPGLRVEVQGHTDTSGTPESNVRLSQSRAKNVVEYLVKHGIDTDRMVPNGYGQNHPIASNDNFAGRSQNRRVELKTIK